MLMYLTMLPSHATGKSLMIIQVIDHVTLPGNWLIYLTFLNLSIILSLSPDWSWQNISDTVIFLIVGFNLRPCYPLRQLVNIDHTFMILLHYYPPRKLFLFLWSKAQILSHCRSKISLEIIFQIMRCWPKCVKT